MFRVKRSIGLSKNENVRESGVIHAYDAFKGYGFIRRTKGKDVFFFYDELPDGASEPSEGDIVSFEIEVKPKGPRAKKIQVEGHVAS
ncbi:TPA: cold shock domain-containing protein [Vibrio vulnificus]|nr:cold shock domain-containing protein [Vibrio vulnificus]HAS8451097.1 cold shock domain-containing protein [Vibrio vulnificus]